jgi:hypothetical protein
MFPNGVNGFPKKEWNQVWQLVWRSDSIKIGENVENVRTPVWNDQNLTLTITVEEIYISTDWIFGDEESLCKDGFQKHQLQPVEHFCSKLRITNGWIELSLQTKAGFFSSRACSGNLQPYPTPGMCGCQNERWDHGFFFTAKKQCPSS